MRGLVFVLFEDGKYEYCIFESKHGLMTMGSARNELIEAIKKEVHKEFNGNFTGKVIVREFIDEVLNF